jgi:hypothetical protein
MAIFIQNHRIEAHLFDSNSNREIFTRLSGLLAVILGRSPVLLAIGYQHQT